MCGIVGEYRRDDKYVQKESIESMLNQIVHRGPDFGNLWVNKHIGLGHRLLKIQDLSQLSAQPYKYNNLVMTYNGEIYNFIELRDELKKEGYTFESIGDTEVLIKCFDKYGIEKTLNKIEGCFAIGLYDLVQDKLYLIRDRFGIKPLHYYMDNEKVIFSSEIKSIIENKTVKRKYNLENVIISLACKLWMHPKWTMFENIYNVMPGTYLEITKEECKEKKYYELKYDIKNTNVNDIVNKFEKLFTDSVKRKLISQVPLAAFLSGGIDSSLLCKVAQDNYDGKLNTYTICYEKDEDLDLNHAIELAEKENFEQHNILIPEKFYTIENIDTVTKAVEEILIDKVYIPVYFNYKAAKEDGFTVVLNGQGSDETWLGYIFNWRIFDYIKDCDDKKKLIEDYYLPNIIFRNKFKMEYKEKINATLDKYLEDVLEKQRHKEDDDKLNDYSIMALQTILHDLLLQEDKLAMAHSVESRVPFVDSHKIVELSMSIPGKIKIQDGREKYILRKFGKDLLPKSIIERKKLPFPEPPSVYNTELKRICLENWEAITSTNIIKEIIDEKYIKSIDNFNERELWYLLVYWRFENVFNVEV